MKFEGSLPCSQKRLQPVLSILIRLKQVDWRTLRSEDPGDYVAWRTWTEPASGCSLRVPSVGTSSCSFTNLAITSDIDGRHFECTLLCYSNSQDGSVQQNCVVLWHSCQCV